MGLLQGGGTDHGLPSSHVLNQRSRRRGYTKPYRYSRARHADAYPGVHAPPAGGEDATDVAALVEMPEESVKTLLRVVLRDGFSALHDRRLSAAPPNVANALPSSASDIRPPRSCRDGLSNLAPRRNTLNIPAYPPGSGTHGGIVVVECRSAFGATVCFGIGNYCRALPRAGSYKLAEPRCGAIVVRQARRPTTRLSRRPPAKSGDHSTVDQPGQSLGIARPATCWPSK